MSEELIRKVWFSPAYDKTKDPRGNFGIHGVEILFSLVGPKGAASFTVHTDWYLPHNRNPQRYPSKADGACIAYHAKVPQYEDQNISRSDCEFTGGECYADGRYHAASELFEKMVAEGDEVVWTELQEVYDSIETVGWPTVD